MAGISKLEEELEKRKLKAESYFKLLLRKNAVSNAEALDAYRKAVAADAEEFKRNRADELEDEAEKIRSETEKELASLEKKAGRKRDKAIKSVLEAL